MQLCICGPSQPPISFQLGGKLMGLMGARGCQLACTSSPRCASVHPQQDGGPCERTGNVELQQEGVGRSRGLSTNEYRRKGHFRKAGIRRRGPACPPAAVQAITCCYCHAIGIQLPLPKRPKHNRGTVCQVRRHFWAGARGGRDCR